VLTDVILFLTVIIPFPSLSFVIAPLLLKGRTPIGGPLRYARELALIAETNNRDNERLSNREKPDPT
jgi:hypothetical protein